MRSKTMTNIIFFKANSDPARYRGYEETKETERHF